MLIIVDDALISQKTVFFYSPLSENVIQTQISEVEIRKALTADVQ
jgi:hypothetical protein